jgi:hypothetical protein
MKEAVVGCHKRGKFEKTASVWGARSGEAPQFNVVSGGFSF